METNIVDSDTAQSIFSALVSFMIELGISEERADVLFIEAGELQIDRKRKNDQGEEEEWNSLSGLIKTLAIMVKNELGKNI